MKDPELKRGEPKNEAEQSDVYKGGQGVETFLDNGFLVNKHDYLVRMTAVRAGAELKGELRLCRRDRVRERILQGPRRCQTLLGGPPVWALGIWACIFLQPLFVV